MPTAPKWLKVRTLNLAYMLPGSPDMTPKKILNSLTGIEKPALVAMVTKIWEF